MAIKENKRVLGQPNRKVITQYDSNGVLLLEWPSIHSVCRTLQIDRSSLRRHLKRSKGYKTIKSFKFCIKRIKG